jgi:hypothetical protein
MMRGTGLLGVGVAAATATAVLIGFAGPADATYRTEPFSLAWHPAGPVHSMVARNGVVYLGGRLNGTGGVAAVSATNGRLLWQIPADNDVRALALSPDGRTLYAGGGFTHVGGAPHRGVVAIGIARHRVISSWKGAATGGAVRDLVTRGEHVYVAGRITSVGGVPHRGIGALDAQTGKEDPRFDFSANDSVLGLARTGNRLIVTGRFTRINGIARAELASIDLSSNTLTQWKPPKLCSSCDQYWDVKTDGTNAYVATSGNAAGAFSLATGRQLWPTIRGTGDFQAACVPGDGKVYFGGHFGEVWTGPRGHDQVDAGLLVAVSAATGKPVAAWTPRLIGAYPGVWSLTSFYGKLWVGGDFAGEKVNGSNNKLPYLAAYPDPRVAGDTTAPTGRFHARPTKAWARSTRVTVVQTRIHDNRTRAGHIERRVRWGDGRTTEWTRGRTVSHVYRSAGRFRPRVLLTDEAGNSSRSSVSSAIRVKVDAHRPTVTLAIPRHPHSVRAWRVLDGTANDAGAGVATVSVKAVEKRGGSWRGYDVRTHHWRTAASRKKAFAAATTIRRPIRSGHHWSARLRHLHQGILVTRVWAVDKAGNWSHKAIHRALLTHR